MRIGIVGCGAIAQLGHIPALLRSPHATLAAVCDTDRAWAAEIARRHHVDLCSDDYTDLAGAVDGVIIATPTASHLPIAGYFLGKGVHVLCEKPAALSSSEVHEMFAAAHAGARLLVGQSRRFSQQALAVRRLLEEGVVGPVHTFTASLGGVYSGWKARTDFRLDRAAGGGGALIDSGLHLLDLAVWLLEGEPSLVEYVASRPPGWEVEGDAEVSLLFGRSSAASIACSYTHGLRAALRIEGEAGWIKADLNEPNVQFFSSRSHVCRVDGCQWMALGVETDYEAQLEHFCRCVRDEEPFVVSEAQVASVLEIIEACYRARENESRS